MFFSCLWHTSVLSVPHTRHSLSIYYLDRAPNIRYYQMLILLFSFRLTSSLQSIHHHPHSVNSRGLPLANRPLHSIAHIMDSLASQLLRRLCLRGVTVSPSPQSQIKEEEKLHALRKYAHDFRHQHTTDAEWFNWDSDDEDYGLAIGRLVVT
jgi:hypothetical protein